MSYQLASSHALTPSSTHESGILTEAVTPSCNSTAALAEGFIRPSSQVRRPGLCGQWTSPEWHSERGQGQLIKPPRDAVSPPRVPLLHQLHRSIADRQAWSVSCTPSTPKRIAQGTYRTVTASVPSSTVISQDGPRRRPPCSLVTVFGGDRCTLEVRTWPSSRTRLRTGPTQHSGSRHSGH